MKFKILVIDDEKEILNSIKRILSNKNMKIILCNNPENAFNLIESKNFDVVISDQKMPGYSGVDILKHAKKVSSRIVTILMTGYKDISPIIEAINEANIYKYIQKPWDKSELNNTVEKAIEKKKELDIQWMSKKFLEKNDLISPIKNINTNNDSYNNILVGQGIKILLKILEVKDTKLLKHSKNVASFSKKFAKHLNLSEKSMEIIYYSGLLHDIGKIAIKDKILYKKGKLSDNEYNNMKYHAEIGANIIREVNGLEKIALVVEQHHEQFNGKGYPNGLSKDDILIEAQILSIVDTYFALKEKRVYKEAYNNEKTEKILKNMQNTKFNPLLVKKFINFK
ncbi:MAG: HD domain-containing phosphohydrolase [Bacillota bacterium]